MSMRFICSKMEVSLFALRFVPFSARSRFRFLFIFFWLCLHVRTYLHVFATVFPLSHGAATDVV